jgi:hypothetical protein
VPGAGQAGWASECHGFGARGYFSALAISHKSSGKASLVVGRVSSAKPRFVRPPLGVTDWRFMPGFDGRDRYTQRVARQTEMCRVAMDTVRRIENQAPLPSSKAEAKHDAQNCGPSGLPASRTCPDKSSSFPYTWTGSFFANDQRLNSQRLPFYGLSRCTTFTR